MCFLVDPIWHAGYFISYVIGNKRVYVKNRCVHFDVTMFTHKTMRSDLRSEKEKNIIQTIIHIFCLSFIIIIDCSEKMYNKTFGLFFPNKKDIH